MVNLFRCGGGGNGKYVSEVLWENPTPTATFPAQTIALDLREYDAVLIKGQNSNTIPETGSSQLINIGSSGIVSAPRTGYPQHVCYRTATVTNTGVTFTIGTSAHASNSTNDAYFIPTEIRGVKRGNVSVGVDQLIKFDVDAGGIFAVDDTGEWTLIHKTDCLPISLFDGVLYNNGTWNMDYFDKPYVATIQSGAVSFNLAYNNNRIYLAANGPASGTSTYMVCFTTPIDVRRFNVLNVANSGTWNPSNAGAVCIGFGTSTDINAVAKLSAYKSVSIASNTVQLDVRNYDEIYLYFYITCSGGSFTYERYQYISKIWLTN